MSRQRKSKAISEVSTKSGQDHTADAAYCAIDHFNCLRIGQPVHGKKTFVETDIGYVRPEFVVDPENQN